MYQGKAISKIYTVHIKKVYSKIWRLKLYVLRQWSTMNKILIFFLIVSLEFIALIPASFPLVEVLWKLLFWYETTMVYCSMSYRSLNLSLVMNFQFKKKKQLAESTSGDCGESCSCIILFFTKNCLSKSMETKKYWKLALIGIDFVKKSRPCYFIITLLYKLLSCAHIFIWILNNKIWKI